MADTAAHLVDHVFPVVPVRQWVLSSPFALRYKMAYDARLMSDVLNIFATAVLGHLRRRARKSRTRCDLSAILALAFGARQFSL